MSYTQMSLIASILIIFILLLRKYTLYKLPKITFICLWGIVVFRLLCPILIEFNFDIFSMLHDKLTGPTIKFNHNDSFFDNLQWEINALYGEYYYYQIAIHVIGMILFGAFFITIYAVQRRRFKNRTPVFDEYISNFQKDNSLKRDVRIFKSTFTKNPLTYGVIKPIILLPYDFDLSNKEHLDSVLQHEYAHIKHFDSIKKLVLIVTLCVHWFNPLVWVMLAVANNDIEIHCDERVIKDGKERKSYANALIDLIEINSTKDIMFNHFSAKATNERILSIVSVNKNSIVKILFSIFVIIYSTIVFTKDIDDVVTLNQVHDMTMLESIQYMFSNENVNIRNHTGLNLLKLIPPKDYVPKTDEEIMAELDKDGMLLNGKGDSYKVIVPVDDEIKNIIADSIRDAFVNNKGYEQGEGHSVDRKEYIMTQPKDERLKVSYTLEQYQFSIVEKYTDKIKEHNPNWQWGDSYDPSILEGFDPTKLVLDTRA